jgi:hypothetical protein
MFLVLVSLIFFSAYLAIGYYFAQRLVKIRFIEADFIFIGSVAISCLLYLILFGIYVISPFMGAIMNICLVLSGLVVLTSQVTRAIKKPIRAGHFLVPLFLCMGYFCVFSVVFSTCRLDKNILVANNNNFCHISNLPIDNSLPFLYADNLSNNKDSDLIVDWKLTDRPPVQIGVALSSFGLGFQRLQTYEMYYAVSVFLQITCIGALYSFLSILRVKRRDIVLITSAVALSSFVYINSVFVWPKLLSSGFMIAGILQLIHHKTLRTRLLPSSAFFIALSLLTHSGTLFTLLGFVPVLGYMFLQAYRSSFKKGDYKLTLLALGIFLMLIMPWQLYKGSQDSRDRLVKWHFAGIIDANDKKSNLEAIRYAYTSVDLKTISRNKTENIKTMVKSQVTVREKKESYWSAADTS